MLRGVAGAVESRAAAAAVVFVSPAVLPSYSETTSGEQQQFFPENDQMPGVLLNTLTAE